MIRRGHFNAEAAREQANAYLRERAARDRTIASVRQLAEAVSITSGSRSNIGPDSHPPGSREARTLLALRLVGDALDFELPRPPTLHPFLALRCEVASTRKALT